MATQTAGELIWLDLERQLQDGTDVEAGVWEDLKEASNISTYLPVQAQGVVHRQLESDRAGPYYMLNNPEADTYLKLDPKDFYVWSLMDGTQSVKQLVVAYFSEFGSIAFSRVTDLVAQLRASSFLTDPPSTSIPKSMQRPRGAPLPTGARGLCGRFCRRTSASAASTGSSLDYTTAFSGSSSLSLP